MLRLLNLHQRHKLENTTHHLQPRKQEVIRYLRWASNLNKPFQLMHRTTQPNTLKVM